MHSSALHEDFFYLKGLITVVEWSWVIQVKQSYISIIPSIKCLSATQKHQVVFAVFCSPEHTVPIARLSLHIPVAL